MKNIIASISVMTICTVSFSFGAEWSLGLTVSPALTVPQSSFDLPSPKVRFNYSFGAVAVCDLSPGLSAKVALQYSRASALLVRNVPDTRAARDPETGRIDLSKVVYGDASEVFESITLPIAVNYSLSSNDSFSLILSGGLGAGYLFQRKSILDPTSTGEMVTRMSQHTFVVSATLGIGVRYPVSPNIGLLLIPAYSYSFYPDQYFGSLNFHTMSVEFAVLFHL